MVDAREVQAPRGNVRGDQRPHASRLEVRDGAVARRLREPAVDRSCFDSVLGQPPAYVVHGDLHVREDERLGDLPVGVGHPLHGAEERIEPVLLGHVHKGLIDVRAHRADSAHGDPEVPGVQEVQRHVLHLLRERRGEHGRLALALAGPGHRHAVLFYDLPDLRLEAHVQHPVGLVERQVPDLLHGHQAARAEVLKAARRADGNVAAIRQLLQLLTGVRPTVHRDRADARPEADPLRLRGDLLAKLARRSEDDAGGRHRPILDGLLLFLQDGGHDRHQEGRRLAAPGLGAAHHVRPQHRRGHAVLLHGRRLVVAAPREVVGELLRHIELLAGLRKGLDRLLGALAADGLHGDVVVLLEVDALAHVRRLEEPLLLVVPVAVVPPWRARLGGALPSGPEGAVLPVPLGLRPRGHLRRAQAAATPAVPAVPAVPACVAVGAPPGRQEAERQAARDASGPAPSRAGRPRAVCRSG
mmetsp:Transcript_109981/g.328808  ORF Transcript_109981/g.328808 Transcript_109981/m.328808 type:complete len:471 (-) Transcript_109981:153-1565(-)